MQLRTQIQSLFNEGGPALFDASFSRVAPERVVREYSCLREYVLKNTCAGDIVAIRADYGFQFTLAVLACMESGITFLPLSPHWPEQRIASIQANSKFKLCLDQKLVNEIVAAAPPSSASPGREATGNTPLYVIYTSGSTGEPKGVVIHREAFTNFVNWSKDYYSTMTKGTRHLMTADFTFDISMMDTALLISRHTAVGYSQFRANMFTLASEIGKFKAEMLTTVPNNVNMLLHNAIASRADYSSIKFLLLGGSRFALGTYHNIFRYFGNKVWVDNLYGPTEATIYSHIRKLSGDEAQDSRESTISIGKPLPHMACEIIDETGKRISEPGKSGELVLSGIQIMKGYLNDPERTAKVLSTMNGMRYYRTGDISFMDERGEFYITGRNDETLKRRGFRVNLQDIDGYIQKIPEVQDAVTVAEPHPNYENYLICYVIPRSTMTTQALREKMRGVLVDTQIPDEIHLVESFPTNNSGKIDRKALRNSLRKAA